MPALLLALAIAVTSNASAQTCAPATWYSLAEATPQAMAERDVLMHAAKRDVALVGEQHDNPDHHRWQLQTLSVLHALRPNIVIGFEALPRRVQPVVDRWIAGELTPKEFLERVEWHKIWGFPPELYMPLFEFARANRIRIIALNVERALTESVASKGWDAVPAAQREGVTTPAPAEPAYRAELFDVYKEHRHAQAGKAAPSENDAAFHHFVESQLTWDRAMAEALAAALKSDARDGPLAIGIIGSGHLQFGWGVAHQLKGLGVRSVATLLPFDTASCSEMKPRIADAAFILPARRADEERPRLGVRLDSAGGVVRIAEVTAGGLAEQSGLRNGDVIVTLAGKSPSGASAIAAAVRAQPPGTWLPLTVRRGESMLEVVIKFPP